MKQRPPLYPLGSIFPYSAEIDQNSDDNLIAAGYIPCDGLALDKSRSSPYSDLYDMIGDAFGGDDYNFYVPDLRGRFLRGTNQGAVNRDPNAKTRDVPRPHLVSTGNRGDNVGSVQDATFQTHKHDYEIRQDTHRCNDFSLLGSNVYKKIETHNWYQSSESGGNETRPKNIYVNFLIAYK